jgi:hypothetical protein
MNNKKVLCRGESRGNFKARNPYGGCHLNKILNIARLIF